MSYTTHIEWFPCPVCHTPIPGAPRIKPRSAGVELGVDHRNPALTSEYFPLRVSVISRETRPLRDLTVSLSLADKSTVDRQATGEELMLNLPLL